MKQLIIYSEGICALSVCVPADLTTEAIERDVNLQRPTGIQSRWKVSKDETFKTGESIPCVCENANDRLHYLLSC